jgi:hypothetical protein
MPTTVPTQHPITIATIEIAKHVLPNALDSGSLLDMKMIPAIIPTIGIAKDATYRMILRHPL